MASSTSSAEWPQRAGEAPGHHERAEGVGQHHGHEERAGGDLDDLHEP
jgi:hypothetical protein